MAVRLALARSSRGKVLGPNLLCRRITLLSREDIAKCAQVDANSAGLISFYSSCLGGITKDAGLAMVHVDDHGFHRGHAVFDTCNVVAGRVFGLDMHLDRLFTSAKSAGLVPPPKDELREIVLHTVAASGHKEGFVRYWLTAGRGNFAISPKGCTPAFYVAYHTDERSSPPTQSAAVVNVPLKPDLLATMKTNNYLLNALVAMEAQKSGANLGIQVDDGFITESAVSCIGIVTRHPGCSDGQSLRFVVPSFHNILASTTAQRAFAVVPGLTVETSRVEVERRPIATEELYTALEVISLGGHHVQSIGVVDGITIGDGKNFPVFEQVHRALTQEMLTNEALLDDVPYHLYENPGDR